MKRFILTTALTLMTGTAAMAQDITQPHCNEGSACRAAMQDLQANPNHTALNANQAWGLAHGSLDVGTSALCTDGRPHPGCGQQLHPLGTGQINRPPHLDHCELPQFFSRVFDPDHLVGTTDYWPEMFNLTTDADGMITTAGCG